MNAIKKNWRIGAESGFSLLELMVAVSIVAVMVGMITPHLMTAAKSARATACQGNIKTIQDALAEYDLLHNALPSGDSQTQLTTLVSDQLLSNDVLNGQFSITDTDPTHVAVTCSSASLSAS